MASNTSNFILRKFLSASALVFGLGVLAKVVGLFREIVVADAFGLSPNLDLFYLALLVPLYLLNTLINPLGSSVVPVLNQLKLNDKNEAVTFTNSVLTWLLFGLCFIAVVLPLCSDLIARILSVSTSDYEKFNQFTWIFGALIVLQGLGSYVLIQLESEKIFGLSSLQAFLSSGGVIAFLWFESSITSMANGLLVGALFFLGISLAILYFKTDIRLGISLKLDTIHKPFRQQYALLFASSLMMGSTFVVDQGMASFIGPTNVSAVNYGFRVVSLFTGMGALALGSVALPYFSELAAIGQKDELRKLVRQILGITFLSSGLIIAGIFFFGDFIVSMLFERGSFSNQNVEIVASIFKWYSVQLPFYIGGIVLVRLIASFKNSRPVLWISFGNLLLNII